jgi:uncharacterized membrane protein
LILPILSPAVNGLTLVYYASGRRQRAAAGVDAEASARAADA